MTAFFPDAAKSDLRDAGRGTRRRVTGLESALLFFVIAAFAYEIPLVNLTGFYRTNPHLFDIAAVLLVTYWLFRGWPISLSNPIMKPWAVITAVFLLDAMMTGFFVSGRTYLYSLFFALRYLEGFMVLVIMLSAPIDETLKRRLLWMGLIGGAWVSFYALLQFFGVVSVDRYLPNGDLIPLSEGAVNSTLGTTYFHIGQYSTLAGLIGFSLFQCSRGRARVIAAALTPFVIIPSVISGSRAGFAAVVISSGFLAMQREYRKYFATYVMAALLGLVMVYFSSISITAGRIEEGRGGSLTERLGQGPVTLAWALRDHGARLLIMGGDFMVVPLGGRHRIGYGNHNIFLFPLEQGGIPAFVAALWLWIRIGRNLRKRPIGESANGLNARFRAAMFAYLCGLLVVGTAGQVFFLGFGTENLTFYQLVLFGLALTKTEPATQNTNRPEIEPLRSPFLEAARA